MHLRLGVCLHDSVFWSQCFDVWTVKAPSSKAAGPVVEWNYVFLLFWSQLVISEKQRFPWYTSCTLHFSHSFFFHSFNFNETVRGRIKCYWSRGKNVLIVFLSFFFLGKNKTKLFWFARSTLLCSPRRFRVFVILHSTTFHVEYNFWIDNTYGSVRVGIVT